MSAIFILPLVGAAIMTVLGFIWYGPLFGKPYMAAMGMNPENTNPDRKSIIVTTAIEFVMSYVLLFGFLILMNLTQSATYPAALTTAALFWLFFMVPQKASSVLWTPMDNRRKWIIFGLNASYSLVSIVIVAILFLWSIYTFFA